MHAYLELPVLQARFEAEKEKYLDDFFTFLRFASIATDPSFKPDVLKCKEWLHKYLVSIGMQVESWDRGNAPILFAEDASAGPNQPTLLLYCHYDVQPVDPIDLWTTPPFEPHIREGEIFARGAVDNKGQCFYTLLALKTLREHYGHIPVNIKFLIEGEEESGSSGLFSILEEKKKRLKADHLLIVDSGIEAMDKPSVSLGARGIVTFTLHFTGSKFDLHSGSHGGCAYNPNRALVELLASLHDANGKVNIPGFYEGVLPLTDKEKEVFDLSFDEEEYRQMFGCSPSGMEKGVSPAEAIRIRPTLEINGISGGYAGPGFKTVIPAEASAKISCRLIPNQDPDRIINLVTKTLKERVSQGVKLEIEVHPGKGWGVRTKPDSKIAQVMAQAYTDVFGLPCRHILIGGSIPIAADLARISGAEMALVGLSLPDDQIHAPDEHFGIERLKKGYLTIVRGIEILSNSAPLA